LINSQEIRNVLAIALASQLGIYTFSNGQTRTAIVIDDNSDPLLDEVKKTGLELVIVPSIRVPIASSFGSFRQTFSVEIIANQWDITQTTLVSMPLILDTMKSQFSHLRLVSAERILRSLKLDNIETFSLTVSQEFLMD